MNEIARFNGTTAVALPSIAWSSRQLDTIKRTVAKDTNNDEFDLFIEYCKVKGLDPFSRQAIAVPALTIWCAPGSDGNGRSRFQRGPS